MSMDLSTAHAPIGQFLEQPKDQEEWQKFRLTEGQIASFNEVLAKNHLKELSIAPSKLADSTCSVLSLPPTKGRKHKK